MLGWLGAWLYKNMGREPPPAREAPPPPPQDPWSRQWRALRNVLIAIVIVGVVGAAAGGAWLLLGHRASDWAVIVVAGDWHAHDGGPTEGFDNARRDVSAALTSIGFKADNIAQFSARPENYPSEHVQPSDTQTLAVALLGLSTKTSAGCLLYFSSHGAPNGVLLGGQFLTPDTLSRMLDQTCGKRPTVVIISACFSGTFVPVLKGDNRMILTAARPDRTSFGCGQDNKYPFFDTCVLATIHAVHGFPELADKVRACVAQREADTGMSPPSEPQVFVGPKIAAALPRW
jgi:hypothetical protein